MNMTLCVKFEYVATWLPVLGECAWGPCVRVCDVVRPMSVLLVVGVFMEMDQHVKADKA